MPNTDQLLELEKTKTIGEDIPVAYFELVDQKNSGFIQEGTENLPKPIQITAPNVRQIRRKSYYFQKDAKGVPKRVNTRYIMGVEEIEVEKQKAAGHEENPQSDYIHFKKGGLIVAREGNSIGLYDYLKKHSGNVSNDDRDPSADKVFREVLPEKEKMELNDMEFAIADALAIIRKLQIEKKGDKVKYDEVKLNSYAKIFQITGSSPVAKMNALIAVAKAFPDKFMETLKEYEVRFMQEIIHGEELSVLKYTGNVIGYANKPDVILSLPGAFLSKESLRTKLAAYFQSEDGAVAYQEFLIELDAAKTASLKN